MKPSSLPAFKHSSDASFRIPHLLRTLVPSYFRTLLYLYSFRIPNFAFRILRNLAPRTLSMFHATPPQLDMLGNVPHPHNKYPTSPFQCILPNPDPQLDLAFSDLERCTLRTGP
jgi:hypothetical protein